MGSSTSPWRTDLASSRPSYIRHRTQIHSEMIPQEILDKAVKYHGHYGPFLVIGIRASLYALQKMGNVRVCHIFCPQKKPYLCVSDGVMSVIGCKILHHKGEGIRLCFEGAGNTLCISVHGELIQTLSGSKWNELEKLAEMVRNMEFSDIFEVS
ncbi:MAG TPA: hypothetical protein ENF41_02040 [Candidatus Bathyarchaeota archaeon]|nr:hypothetical protein [Candidatus Bathyarchaeota archaeon]